jgi:hypothetical protein
MTPAVFTWRRLLRVHVARPLHEQVLPFAEPGVALCLSCCVLCVQVLQDVHAWFLRAEQLVRTLPCLHNLV